MTVGLMWGAVVGGKSEQICVRLMPENNEKVRKGNHGIIFAYPGEAVAVCIGLGCRFNVCQKTPE
ncbi:CLUMA_CG018445, isoform A [Clunio marinus]|uniref:CLUMA_CG018445, isoform A n=1 Tax=Clunio marinus TaxID=568069 RepID=A0A1J1IXK0_9DIPT|nr:CLUMA_CG018445, isoform A [Clunio marinus]